MEELETNVTDLKVKNSALLEQIDALEGENKLIREQLSHLHQFISTAVSSAPPVVTPISPHKS